MYGLIKDQNVYKIKKDSIAFDKNIPEELIREDLGIFKVEFIASYLHLINSSLYFAHTTEWIKCSASKTD